MTTHSISSVNLKMKNRGEKKYMKCGLAIEADEIRFDLIAWFKNTALILLLQWGVSSH